MSPSNDASPYAPSRLRKVGAEQPSPPPLAGCLDHELVSARITGVRRRQDPPVLGREMSIARGQVGDVLIDRTTSQTRSIGAGQGKGAERPRRPRADHAERAEHQACGTKTEPGPRAGPGRCRRVAHSAAAPRAPAVAEESTPRSALFGQVRPPALLRSRRYRTIHSGTRVSARIISRSNQIPGALAMKMGSANQTTSNAKCRMMPGSSPK